MRKIVTKHCHYSQIRSLFTILKLRSLNETEIRDEQQNEKRRKARMNLITLYPVVIKLNFTLSSKYEYYYTKGRTQEEKGE